MVGYLGGIREERKAIILISKGWRLYGRLRREPNPANNQDRGGSKYACDTDRMAVSQMDNPRYFRDLDDLTSY